MAITINIGKSVFNDLYWQFKNAGQHYQIFYGGASAGKSVFVAQRLVGDLLQGDRNYLVVRNIARTSRQSTFTQVKKIIEGWRLDKLFHINKSDLTVTCNNGYQAIFTGLDDVEKLKSITPAKGVLTDVWIEEATETKEADLLQLERRMRGRSQHSKRIIMTFNPIMRTHWIYKRFFNGVADGQKVFEDNNRLIVHSTYKDNKFLTEQDIEILENETDSYFYDVYTLGKWGVLGDVIFTNWKVSDIDRTGFDNYRYGLDFGYSNDPAAFVELVLDRKHKKLYILNELYERGLTNPELATKIKPVCGRNYVYCDSAEPKSVAELRLNGVNAIGAEKGKDSVLFGIQWLQQYEIIIDKRCQNAINEFQLYQWVKNKQGETLNKPIDKYNHIIDSVRYALSNDMKGEREISYASTGKRRAYARLGGFIG